tara:strand:+ start:15717 stop:16322 length:606 start_codon:yes stop_codon:yes gene_type:complete
MTNQEIISQAYNSLSGKWLKTLFPFFIVALIPNLYQPSVNYSPPIYLAFISLFASGPIIYGGSLLALKISKNEDFNFEMIFAGFNHFIKTLLLYVSFVLIIIAGLILFIIPGIYFSLKYAMCFFALVENPEISIGEALQKSSDLMKEDKWKLFLLYLLFFLIVLAGFITLIGWLWAFPLIYVSNAIFYDYLKNKKQITKSG